MDHLLSKEKDVRKDVLTSDVKSSCSVLKDLERFFRRDVL